MNKHLLRSQVAKAAIRLTASTFDTQIQGILNAELQTVVRRLTQLPGVKVVSINADDYNDSPLAGAEIHLVGTAVSAIARDYNILEFDSIQALAGLLKEGNRTVAGFEAELHCQSDEEGHMVVVLMADADS